MTDMEAAVISLVITNLVTAGLLVFKITEGRNFSRGETMYYIVEHWEGEILQGPLTRRKALRAQRIWSKSFTYSGGPRTDIVPIGVIL